MSKFVILNFEDDDQGHTPNATVPVVMRKGSGATPVTTPAHVTGSAQATVQGIAAHARSKESFFQKNHVYHYSGIELIRRDQAGTLTRQDVTQLRTDIARAEKVYIILHGAPDVTEHGFTNAQTTIGWRELGKLALLLFPQRTETYRISLVMCYGARTDNYRLNHLGQMAPGDLKTSFAYKFFRTLCVSRRIVMTACTGAVSTQAGDGTNEVETEEWVSATLDIVDYKKDKAARDLKKQQLDQVMQGFLNSAGGSKQAWQQMYQAFELNRNKVPNGPVETAIKNYLAQTSHLYADLQAAKNAAAQMHQGRANMNKYGRIRYEYDGAGVLRIVNKYGDPLQAGIGPDYLLYSGPLL